MKFQTYSYSNSGGKKNNADSYFCGDNIWLMANAAGRNGTEMSVSASAIALFYTEWEKNGYSTDELSLKETTKAVSNRLSLLSEQDSTAYQSGVMMAAAVFTEPELHFFSIGNCRIYYFKNGRISNRTADDSVSGALCSAGYLPYEDIRNHPYRRSLIQSLEKADISIPAEKLSLVSVTPGDAFLLCTDGFWEQVYEMEMEIDLSKSENPEQWLSYMTKRILLRKNTCKTDSFSATCVMIDA